LLAFHHFQFERFFRFSFRLFTGGAEAFLDARLNRQIELALRVIQFTLLLEEVGLGLLGFGQFGLALFKNLLKFSNGPGFLLKIEAQGELGFPRFLGREGGSLAIESVGDLPIEILLLLREGLFSFA
jgi:hypothetical protein